MFILTNFQASVLFACLLALGRRNPWQVGHDVLLSQVFLEGFTGEAFLGLVPEALRQLEVVDSSLLQGKHHVTMQRMHFFCIYRKVDMFQKGADKTNLSLLNLFSVA